MDQKIHPRGVIWVPISRLMWENQLKEIDSSSVHILRSPRLTLKKYLKKQEYDESSFKKYFTKMCTLQHTKVSFRRPSATQQKHSANFDMAFHFWYAIATVVLRHKGLVKVFFSVFPVFFYIAVIFLNYPFIFFSMVLRNEFKIVNILIWPFIFGTLSQQWF